MSLGGFAAALAVAAVLAVAAAAWDRWPGDVAVTREVQGWPQPAGAISEAVRAVTGTEVVVAAGLLLAVVLALAGKRQTGICCALLFAALPVVQWSVKQLVDRPRPPDDLVDVRATGTSPSFPAGHVMSGTVLVCVLVAWAWASPVGLAWKWSATALGAGVIVLGAVANVHVGAHWPSDVAGGLAWAAVLLAAAGLFLRVQCRRQ
jgi:membrane-associated phospholipid phosphatase